MSSTRDSSGPRTLIDAIEQSISRLTRTAAGVEVPHAILWTDPVGQWSAIVPMLKRAMPNFYELGAYDPEQRRGPAIWLRMIVDGALPAFPRKDGVVPVLYLPGVDRQNLRAGDDCEAAYRPLVELQYRGAVWYQKNGRDWTVEALMVSQEGLGLDVAEDRGTREALVLHLEMIAETPIERFRNARIDGGMLDRLMTPDPVRDVLKWMGGKKEFFAGKKASEQVSFCRQCKGDLGFDPEENDPSDAAKLLLQGHKNWDKVWSRFRESPRQYPGVIAELRACKGVGSIPFDVLERHAGLNTDSEQILQTKLEAAATLPQATAIEKVLDLEKEHGGRRTWLWAELGESPLAMALGPLARLAEAVKVSLGGATLTDTIARYADSGWKCDWAALEAMASVDQGGESKLVGDVVRALYWPWLDDGARRFQELMGAEKDEGRSMVGGTSADRDTCVVFVDGLRYDVGCVLKERLSNAGLAVEMGHRLAPLPTVTATAKVLASVVHDTVEGGSDAENFEPKMKATGQPATSKKQREEMVARGVECLDGDVRAGQPESNGGWFETGQLDELGHKIGDKLPGQIDRELRDLVARITGLLDAGWPQVKVVTDHGWLLMPGGLKKCSLPKQLTLSKWSRCATLHGKATTDVPVFGWHWNPGVRIAVPPGAHRFDIQKDVAFAHGGVSPQECIVPELVVSRAAPKSKASIQDAAWKGMRCKVRVKGAGKGVMADIRTNRKRPESSIATEAKEVGTNGEVSLLVDNDTHLGSAAFIVLLDASGQELDQRQTTVGE